MLTNATFLISVWTIYTLPFGTPFSRSFTFNVLSIFSSLTMYFNFATFKSGYAFFWLDNKMSSFYSSFSRNSKCCEAKCLRLKSLEWNSVCNVYMYHVLYYDSITWRNWHLLWAAYWKSLSIKRYWRLSLSVLK